MLTSETVVHGVIGPGQGSPARAGVAQNFTDPFSG